VQEPDVNETGHDGRGTVLVRPGGAPRRRLPVVAAVTVAGVTAALLVASASHTPPTSHAPSALAAVTGALAKTSADGYSFRLDSAVRYGGREDHSDVVSGAFDPGPGFGTELLATRASQGPVTAQIRFIGRYVYTRVSESETSGKPWDKAPVPAAGAAGMPGNEVYGYVSDQPVNPAGLSGVLRSAGTVHETGPASGPGWTGTRYTFIARVPDGRVSVTGTAYVDQQGRVRRLVTSTTQAEVTKDRDLTFGDFGAPVPVTAPPASQVKYTSSPYWGFFF
jgi:hypothetical protein